MKQEQQTTPKIKSLSYLLRYIIPHKTYMVIMGLALIVSSSSVLIIGKSMQYVIDNGLGDNNPGTLNLALFYLVCMIVILAIATAVRYYFVTLVGEKVVAGIRTDIYKQILRLTPAFYESGKSGEIISRLAGDTTLLQSIIGSSISLAMRNILMLIGSVLILITSNLELSIMMGLMLPIVLLPIKFFGRKMRAYSKLAQDMMADVASYTEETIHGIKTIQAYTCESREIRLFTEKVNSVVQASVMRIKSRAILVALVIGLAFGGIGIILWVGGHHVLGGKISAGQLSSFIFLSVIAAASLSALAEVAGEVQKAAGATERLVEFLNHKPEILDSTEAVSIDSFTGAITLNQVTFYYPSKPNRRTLSGISMNIIPNKVTAIVGESGSGKSTIFQLLLRFYDIHDGEILLDGLNIKDITLESLRKQFAYVSQDTSIFSLSAYENVLYGNPYASREEVVEACRAAAALEFIEKLPNGFDTYLGQKGVRISGGQKQRIAIARAFLKNPKVLLLDEATSALDAQNESLVQQALENIMSGRTTVIIAHRFSTIRNADMIYVLKDGMIAESGSHDQLLKNCGEYHKLLNLQASSVK